MTQTEDRTLAIASVASRVAYIHGSLVDLTELEGLMPEGTTASELELAFGEVTGLRDHYELRDGKVVQKDENRTPGSRDSERRTRALLNLRVARGLASRLGAGDMLTIAVSGSTSYLSAGEGDDIDLFCLTRSGRMWVFVTKALILSRVLRMLRKSPRPITLSCVMDETYAREMFARDQGPLLARDALNAEVLRGSQFYHRFLSSAIWIGSYFPKLYKVKLDALQRLPESRARDKSQQSPLNQFLYIALGTFIRLKATWHNRLLAKRGKVAAVFHAKIGPDHLVYESTRYLALKNLYSRIRPIEPGG